MTGATGDVSKDIFINCPFDAQFSPIFRAYLFVIFACGFRARAALELDDGGQTRIDKIYSLIQECRYGIHDLSRTEADRSTKLPRFNMPLELGIFLGAKRYGGPDQKAKRVIIFDIDKFRYQKFISDLAGMDIHAHAGDPELAITETRNWLANVTRLALPGGSRLIEIYRRFRLSLPSMARPIGFGVDDIPYYDFERILVKWLLEINSGP